MKSQAHSVSLGTGGTGHCASKTVHHRHCWGQNLHEDFKTESRNTVMCQNMCVCFALLLVLPLLAGTKHTLGQQDAANGTCQNEILELSQHLARCHPGRNWDGWGNDVVQVHKIWSGQAFILRSSLCVVTSVTERRSARFVKRAATRAKASVELIAS